MVNISKPHRILILAFLIFLSDNDSISQITYFEQTFDTGGPFSSVTPDNGQFNSLASTSAHSTFQVESSWLKLNKGVADGGTGLVYFQRSSPFSPTPTSLYLEAELTVNRIDGTFTQPAGYFYVGSGISSLTGSIPANTSLTTRFGVYFAGTSSYTIRYVLPGGGFSESVSYPLGQKVHVLLVINQSAAYLPYKDPTGNTSGLVTGCVDIWADQNRFVTATPAFSGSPPTEFGFRLINAPGEIAFDLLRIREVDGILPSRWESLPAIPDSEHIRLSRNDETPLNSGHSEVERLTKAKLITKKVRINPTHEITYIAHYPFIDKNLLPGPHYYRIKQVDQSGLRQYSGIPSAFSYGHHLTWIISPNPGPPERIFVRYTNPGKFNWSLLGFPRKTRKIPTGKSGQTNFEITPIERLNSGIYLLISRLTPHTFTERVLAR